jgi:hypothetical protein
MTASRLSLAALRRAGGLGLTMFMISDLFDVMQRTLRTFFSMQKRAAPTGGPAYA